MNTPLSTLQLFCKWYRGPIIRTIPWFCSLLPINRHRYLKSDLISHISEWNNNYHGNNPNGLIVDIKDVEELATRFVESIK